MEVRLLATAGLRLLEERVQEAILSSCRDVLRASEFRFEDPWAEVIPGSYEGIYAWVAANYALGTLGGDPHKAIGIIELGGASAQQQLSKLWTSELFVSIESSLLLGTAIPLQSHALQQGALPPYTLHPTSIRRRTAALHHLHGTAPPPSSTIHKAQRHCRPPYSTAQWPTAPLPHMPFLSGNPCELLVAVPERFNVLDVVFIFYFPGMDVSTAMLLNSLAKRCSEGSRVVILLDQGRQNLEQHHREHTEVVTSDLSLFDDEDVGAWEIESLRCASTFLLVTSEMQHFKQIFVSAGSYQCPEHNQRVKALIVPHSKLIDPKHIHADVFYCFSVIFSLTPFSYRSQD
ncbi:hypothetical protein GUJ93_ZPchr0002g26420 [Zizania palustris]|uniref:Uncharacterized protein n=1 Tax=Zizania palustris TaxID=103762 RepID=A0A8J5SFR6_ZIZPA|nr:hypothetical protein GUJ93_ZPchr0002g26420 [Zizania palustris]